MKKTLHKFTSQLKWWICALALCSSFSAFAQSSQMRGSVQDEKGQPLIGVSIILKEAANAETRGTTSDIDGNFIFNNLREGTAYDLTFSYIGYEKQVVNGFLIRPATENKLDVKLNPSSANLEEVVVTALGVKKEVKRIGYAVQEVKGEDLVKARDSNPITGLTGKVAGLSVAMNPELLGSPSLLLRGNQISLYVVDGVPISSDTWNISPDDIETYTVLKGPAAAALYGSRAQYGAILITTKKAGKKKGFTVEFNSTNSVDKGFIAVPHTQHEYGGGMYGQYAYADGFGGGLQDAQYQLWGPKFKGQLLPQYDGEYTPDQTYTTTFGDLTYKGHIKPTPYVNRGYVDGKSNLDRFLRAGFQTTNNINLSASGDKYALRFSLSHSNQKGIVPNTGVRVLNFNTTASYQLSKRLTFNANVNFNKTYSDNVPDVTYGPNSLIYNLSVWTGDEWNVDAPDIRGKWQPGQKNVKIVFPEHVHYNNPWMMVEDWKRGHDKTDINGYMSLNYKLDEHLNVTGRSQITTYSLFRSEKMPWGAFTYARTLGQGDYREDRRNMFENNSDVQINYNYNIGRLINLSGLVGGSLRNFNYNSNFTSTDYLVIPNVYNFNNSLNQLMTNNFNSKMRVISSYASLDASIGKYATISATGRVDKSSALPNGSNVYFYPSVSGASVISDYVKIPEIISFLKVRGSFATVHGDATATQIGATPFNVYTTLGGSTAGTLTTAFSQYGNNYLSPYGGPDYSLQAVYSTSKPYNNVTAANSSGSIYDPNIKTFNRKTFEEGIDLRFLANRLGLSGTVFQYIDGPRILANAISPSTGYASYYINALKTKKNGVEISLSGTPIKKEDFSWDVMANWSTFKEVYSELPPGQSNYNTFFKKGDRTDKLYSTGFVKAPDGQIVYDAGGKPLKNPINQFLGYMNADYMWSINNRFKYKNMTMSFQFDGSVGGIISNRLYSLTMQGGANAATVQGALGKSRLDDDTNAGVSNYKGTYVGDGVKVSNEVAIKYDNLGNITNYADLKFAKNTATSTVQTWATQYYGQIQEGMLTSKTYAKLREVVIGYNLPKSWLQGTFIDKVSVSVLGRNLLYFYKDNKYKGIDVEQYNGATAASGLQTPTTRRYGVNLNIVF
ncbi:SusC/RagA family TonB-linked outer membrane protein [Dyadobacter subterraneus]|uniref:SusC/RagA family TonB-linked outer membrane protein n=1 Tax=Dyadobacter subterraneus TaxID=2773304 RepID=A0ABR9WFY2_9BACT|nr:SusC/RagA family TonB-linked outer membrane protein [Dyadobacter subterraneus]MBE9464408.1 SusC/RagA family TonB-linked outer membrane protein [Dyadobacter subterraneus]